MKFTFKPSPNYRDTQSTPRIMMELTIGLLVVYAFALFYYFTNFGSEVGLRAILLLVVAVVSAVGTEAIYDLCTKKPVVKSLKGSFPWVTAIILTMMCQVNISYYALAIATIMAIFFGKLVFGGFGQNIFNPAAVGRAIIMASFAGSIAADVVTGATPTASMSAAGWLTQSSSAFDAFVGQFGGLSNMFVGFYPGAIGETSALAIILVGAFLAYRKVIDWRVPVTYVGTMFVTTLVIGLMKGQAITYPLFHILTGGALFGAVFMMTDPVTNPTSAPGRVIFAMGCAFLTVLIRVKANLPEGVLYSILIMNMMTPAIERLTDGQQIKTYKKNLRNVLIVFVVGLVICAGVGTTLEAKEIKVAAVVDTSSLTDGSYSGTGNGFGGDVTVDITVSGGKVSDVKITGNSETAEIGGAALSTLEKQIVEAGSNDIDGVTGATVTSDAVKTAAGDALSAAAGK